MERREKREGRMNEWMNEWEVKRMRWKGRDTERRKEWMKV